MSEPVELLHCAKCSRLSFQVENGRVLVCTNCWARLIITEEGIRPEVTTCREDDAS